MNIHRKDKAKLKQLAATTSSKLSSEAQLGFSQSVDIPRLPSLYFSPSIDIASKQTQPLLSMAPKINDPETDKSFNWPRFLHRQEDSHGDSFNVDHREYRELPAVYFEDQVPKSEDQEPDTRVLLPENDAEKGEGDQSLRHGDDSGSTEVDLELRLGSSPSRGTKKFF
ncbi:uncharacterized protein LOC116199691 [Punica granatum]|nr:uncharacterized protein LOC116199691 [Punica granatum]